MVEKDKIEISVETISVLKDIPEKHLSSIPDCCGAYVIKVQSGKRYVGSSKTLRTRIQAHKVYNDPNIFEKIISACYYQTENHMDARILEYWYIGKLKPELNREIQPDAATWKKGSKEKLLPNTSDELHELFKELSQRICCLPDVEEVVRKNWITYQTSALKNFCIVKFTKGYLQIDFKDYKDQIKDTTGFSWKIKATQASTFHRRLELRNATQMDIALELITQAYNKMMK